MKRSSGWIAAATKIQSVGLGLEFFSTAILIDMTELIPAGRINISAPRAVSRERTEYLVFSIRKASRGRSHGAKL